MTSRQILKIAARIAETILLPATMVSALVLRKVKRIGHWRLPVTSAMLEHLGITPVLTHYYEPIVIKADLRYPLYSTRHLPGIDMNEAEQSDIINQFTYADELAAFLDDDPGIPGKYYIRNKFFGPGDAEYYYSIIRLRKPRRIIEIGSGYSTLVALMAVQKNREEDPSYICEVTCIEPYHNVWLDATEATVIRSRVEVLDTTLFDCLSENDILFIDSSHAVKPQGDVLHAYFEILPTLQAGVLIHIHDIFTPKDYPEVWVLTDRRLWHEQYIVEALLMYNTRYRIVCALNHQYANHREALEEKFPKLRQNPPQTNESEPGSMWLCVGVRDQSFARCTRRTNRLHVAVV